MNVIYERANIYAVLPSFWTAAILSLREKTAFKFVVSEKGICPAYFE